MMKNQVIPVSLGLLGISALAVDIVVPAAEIIMTGRAAGCPGA